MTCVLLVEDKEENLYYLRALLEGHGWTTESAQHGEEALAKAHQCLPDLVISDLLMPVMDGYTLLRHWKADARLKAVPFVVYTATYTEAEDERLALSLGADAFILKPSEPEEFLARVDAVLARRGAATAIPSGDAHSDEHSRLKQYSETLIRKLEEKTLQLEESNRALRRDAVELRIRDRAIQAVPQGIVIADARLPDCPIIYASPGFEQLTGYVAAQILGRNCRFLQGEDTDPASVAKIGQALQVGQRCTVELLNYRSDGSSFWNSLTISPVVDEKGELSHFVGVQSDITERRHLETQLRQAQKMEAVGLLAGGVAHDFNNLLSVVLSYSIILLEQLNPADPMHADVEEIRRAGERATELTRQLLAFSRQQLLQPRVLDLVEVVRGMDKLLRRLLGEDIELSLLSSRPSGRVFADPGQVEQVLMNLAVNARDAMPGGGKLCIETGDVELDSAYAAEHHDVTPGSYVMLAVTDNGSGMSPATRARIFDPFFTTKEKGKGTGLGLSTVFGIVKQSQGHIWVYSELGQGTTFKVYLPRSEQAPRTLTSPPPGASNLRGTETVLLVEDEEQVRVIVSAILRRNGYHVLEAKNGGEAFLICEGYRAKIHLLLTDVVMPRMSGKQLAARLSMARPGLEVLYMSGYTEDSIVHHGVLDAGIAFLQKPITPNALLRKVREVLTAERVEP